VRKDLKVRAFKTYHAIQSQVALIFLLIFKKYSFGSASNFSHAELFDWYST
jgi:hypothetical protein